MASSAAAFVEGGVQDACDDACSICLESFTDADPAVVTCCKHEYHLQCIIEWSQRSKECPMCWQALSLKDPDSQELLVAVEQERAIRNSRINVSGVFPPEGYELHRISYGDDSDFEERMMRHLALVTMGRRNIGRRDANARTPYTNIPSQFVIVPAPGSPNSGVPAGSLSLTPTSTSPSQGSPATPDSGSSSVPDSGVSRSRGSPRVSSEGTRRSPTENSFSDNSFKSRLAAASSRYKESLTKTTKSFRDKLRMRNGTTMADIGARAREVSAGVVRALERISLESPEHDENGATSGDTSARTRQENEQNSNISTTGISSGAVNTNTNTNTTTTTTTSGVNSTTGKMDSSTDGTSAICLEDRLPKSLDGSTGAAAQQMHLVPMST